MRINQEELFKLYMEEVEHIAEVCDWVTHFGPKEIVTMIANIIENNPSVVENPLYDELVLENTRLKEQNVKLSKRHPTTEEALTQYHWLKANSKRNK